MRIRAAMFWCWLSVCLEQATACCGRDIVYVSLTVLAVELISDRYVLT
ncbi:hypothetical protein SAMN05421752_104116 [Natronorubrum thiooxidans]|uniref:Uncharacterized protein n=1 Tax=Natronorubrum thiooxidans TaxID=308853 RepID=A0A1N7EHN4_9EURY|nr:hypothetical protein SAMN05421752_104116 [Natronorubrum thiooxidans]